MQEPEQSPAELAGAMHLFRQRMLLHAFDHISPSKIGERAAIVLANSDLVDTKWANALSEEELQAVEDHRHQNRLTVPDGPIVVIGTRRNKRRVLSLDVAVVSLEPRIRRAALRELQRLSDTPPLGDRPFLGPVAWQALETFGPSVCDEGIQAARAATAISDALRSDYFYCLSAFWQAAELEMRDVAVRFLRSIADPSVQMVSFLQMLPVWSIEAQESEVGTLLSQIVTESDTLEAALDGYYRHFGHIPAAAGLCAATAVASWCDEHGWPNDLRVRVEAWGSIKGSPLARYHASQVLCRLHTQFAAESAHRILRSCVGTVAEMLESPGWRLRCSLATHYCTQLESLGPNACGDRVASFAWWLAEMLAFTLTQMSAGQRASAAKMIEELISPADNVSALLRSAGDKSVLRWATRRVPSLWAASLLCEIADTGLFEQADSNLKRTIATAVSMLGCGVTVSGHGMGHCNLAFRSDVRPMLAALIATTLPDELAAGVAEISRILESRHSADHGTTIITAIRADEPVTQMGAAKELNLLCYCRHPVVDNLWDVVSSSDWQTTALVRSCTPVFQELCDAILELSVSAAGRDWRGTVSHVFALALEKCDDAARVKELFRWLVASSVSGETVGGVQRALSGPRRRSYAGHAAEWRNALAAGTCSASPWVAAQMRATKAALYV